jgi:Phage P2 GpE
MANLAQTFHWPLSQLKALDIDELMMWHTEALERNRTEKD